MHNHEHLLLEFDVTLYVHGCLGVGLGRRAA
jgi:hypothetical protein